MLWFDEVFVDSSIKEAILMGSAGLGYRPQLTFTDGNSVSVHNVPYTTVKNKYRLIAHDVPVYYYDNIKLIRKLEKFLEVPFVMTFEKDRQNVLSNASSVRYNKTTQQITYEEDYGLHLLVNNIYEVITIKEPLFFEILDDLLTTKLVAMVSDKKFSELTNDDLTMVRIYHYK
jgi:hypothetical protein